MPIGDAENTEKWLQVFEATCRHKKLNDLNGVNEITDFLMAVAGIEAIRRINVMCRPKLVNIPFIDIKDII